MFFFCLRMLKSLENESGGLTKEYYLVLPTNSVSWRKKKKRFWKRYRCLLKVMMLRISSQSDNNL